MKNTTMNTRANQLSALQATTLTQVMAALGTYAQQQKHLSSDSQGFVLEARRQVGWAELPWLTLLGWWLLGDAGIAAGGIACLLGHCFPVYYSFKGGKGVSVGAAIAFAVDWRVFLIVVGAFAIGALLSKKVSLGSLSAAVTISIAAALFGVSTPRMILAIATMAIVLFQHRENIKRLLKGTEPNFKAAKPRKI